MIVPIITALAALISDESAPGWGELLHTPHAVFDLENPDAVDELIKEIDRKTGSLDDLMTDTSSDVMASYCFHVDNKEFCIDLHWFASSNSIDDYYSVITAVWYESTNFYDHDVPNTPVYTEYGEFGSKKDYLAWIRKEVESILDYVLDTAIPSFLERGGVHHR